MKQARILIVDEDPAAAEFYRVALASLAAHELSFATGSPEALKQLAEESFDLVIASIHSPDSDGSDLIKAAHDADRTLDVVLIDAGLETNASLETDASKSEFAERRRLSNASRGPGAAWPALPRGSWRSAAWGPNISCCAGRSNGPTASTT